MSDKKEGNSGSSFWQLMIAIPGTIIGFTLLISLLAHFLSGGQEAAQPAAAAVAAAPAPAAAEPAAKTEEEKNIQPEATVEVAAAPAEGAAAGAGKSGEEVYQQVCAMCHGAGIMNAPKFGDKDAWKARIAQGYDTLASHAINGFNAMPAKGGNPALSDDEVKAAVKHMANSSGASF